MIQLRPNEDLNKSWFSKLTHWLFKRKCPCNYPSCSFIRCNRHVFHLGKHRSARGVVWQDSTESLLK